MCRRGVISAWSCCADRPSGWLTAKAEHAETREVDCCGEQREIGSYLSSAADPGFSAVVFAAHQVPDLALDLGACAGVAGLPVRVCLAGAGGPQLGFVVAEVDAASLPTGGALSCQRTSGAQGTEARELPALEPPQLHDVTRGAGHGPGIQIILNSVFEKRPPGARGGWVLQNA